MDNISSFVFAVLKDICTELSNRTMRYTVSKYFFYEISKKIQFYTSRKKLQILSGIKLN